MSAALRDQLQKTLTGTYTLERELGGGGMSRVFEATETSLGRKVVIKVLPPELSEGVSVERFKREIQLSAQLQHPHIVGVLSAGETSGIPYYTMPLVDGYSLRTRLVKSGAMPITETIGILRDVAKALAYAHERGVVHRDIKPDNVLITGGSAVVTDFGIAKAIAAARTGPSGTTLTQIGTSLGTPAYMAPEQAAADPDTDYRADIYSFGVMAYELLAGRPPFHGRSPQKLLAAQMSETPQPLTDLRPDTPPLLAEMVMRCLEKDADRRPQAGTDLVRVLETVTSGGGHPGMPGILLDGPPRLTRALMLWAAAFLVVAIVARAAIIAIGLPAWVFPGAIVVMLLGLPVILFTHFVHRGAHQAMTMGTLTPGGSVSQQSTFTKLAVKASPWVNWRRTTLGGVAALILFVVLVSGYMITRALGIGPAASLMASGVLGEREKLLIADFKSTSDTTLGPVVTEAVRSDLARSRNIDIVQPTAVREVLRRMQRPPNTAVDYALAREVATREGIKAIVDGEVLALGGGYVITAKLISAQSGDVLATFRETANTPNEIIAAIDRLSRDVRAKIGESLKSVNSAPPLEQVTTPSLAALRKYVQAVRTFGEATDWPRGITLLDEAIALDTGFAMAYRKLAIELGNRNILPERRLAAIQKAYDHRERLSEPERYVTIASYWGNGPKPDIRKSLVAYEEFLEIQPHNTTALSNLALDHNNLRQFEKAELYAARAVAANPNFVVFFNNLLRAQIGLGKYTEVEQTLGMYEKHLPASPFIPFYHTINALRREQYDSAERITTNFRKARSNDRDIRRGTGVVLTALARMRGRISEAARFSAEVREIEQEQGSAPAPLLGAIEVARDDLVFFGAKQKAIATLDNAVRQHGFDKLAPLARPFEDLVTSYSLGGRPDKARAYLADFDESRKTVGAQDDKWARERMLARIATAEGKFDQAIGHYREADQVGCTVCLLPEMARVFDMAGNTDSTLAILTRYVEQKNEAQRLGTDSHYLASSYKRLGELWEQKGDRQKALGYYLKFVELWKNADKELQPTVAQIRQRIERLKDTEGR